MARILVTLVTGFLGSGKTTLLNALLRHPGMADAAVIVNEFGEIGLDHDLVQRSDESVVRLDNGCLCCTVKSDLIDTFRDLHLMRQSGDVPRFQRVVIETTGIADPGPVLQIVLTDPLVSRCYELDGIVTMVDAVNGRQSLERFPESVKQVAVADRVVLTKTDLLAGPDAGERLAAVRERVRDLNPGAALIESAASAVDPAALFGDGLRDAGKRAAELERWLGAERYGEAGAASPAAQPLPDGGGADAAAQYREQGHRPQAASAHDPQIRTFCVVRDAPIAIDALRLFLDALARDAGPDLLRVKGIVHVAERPATPAVIQGAQLIFHSLEWLDAWPSDDTRTRIVFITRGIDRAYVEEAFDLIERVAARTAAAANAPAVR